MASYDTFPPIIILKEDDNKHEEKEENMLLSGENEGFKVPLFIRTPTGQLLSIDAVPNSTIKLVKKLIFKITGFSINKIRLLFAGKLLDDNKLLIDYNITKNCHLNLLFTLPTTIKSIMEQIYDHDVIVHNLNEIIAILTNKGLNINIVNENIKKGEDLIDKLKSSNETISQISIDELLSIYLYSTDLFYDKLNKDCRDNIIGEWKKLLVNMVLCLKKFPFYWETCYYGVKNDSQNYCIGDTITWEQFIILSTTLSNVKKDIGVKEPSDSNNNNNNNNNYTIFEIKSWTGRNLKGLSFFPEQENILLMPSSYLKILNITNIDGYKHVICEEIPLPWGKHYVLWVDDEPHKNKTLMEKLEKNGIATIIRTNTQNTLELLQNQNTLLKKDMSEFRIVTDMVRKDTITNNIDYYAGADLIKKLRDGGYNQEILIYCGDISKAQSNCQDKNVSLDKITITKQSADLEKFCQFS